MSSAAAAEIQKHVEVQAKGLPSAPTLDTLKQMRREQCSSGSDFRLSSFQLFLRRILSPDSPVRNMLLVHGTGTGKTCSAIQVAEEYILRPEFQDKKVMVVASSTVQDNFRTQLFDVQRVKQDPATGILKSPQCTGRRYLEMLERAQSENLRWENPENREKLGNIVQNMISEFYDFSGYIQFANTIDRQSLTLSPNDFAQWVRKTYNGKLLIIDEAHNLREGNGDETYKQVSTSLQKIVKIADSMTLVLLTATPMYDSFQEILFLFNLFLWNDKRQPETTKLVASEFFGDNGVFLTPEAEARFRGYCHDYISFIRGENPFTFPFRLPPPDEMIAPLDRATAFKPKGKRIAVMRKYLPLTASVMQSPQRERVAGLEGKAIEEMIATVVVSPDGRPISKCFEKSTDSARSQLRYAAGAESFLSPSNVAKHSSKFAAVVKCIQESTGIVFVYSNYVIGGVQQFVVALEEHGYEPAVGTRMLENPSGEFKGAPLGRYAFLTSSMTDRQLQTLIRRLRNPANAKGQDIRIVVASPVVSEGVDLKNVRQVHILDPWYNMSRIEQIVGRGLRNCSHAALDFEEQNCTVYLHITRFDEEIDTKKTETYDEYVYRIFVEAKAKNIAVVKRVIEESAVDCMTQLATNQLPAVWRDLDIPQKRSHGGGEITRKLSELSAPVFSDGAAALVCWAGANAVPGAAGEDYVRPLGSYLDIRDEVFDTLLKIFEQKPIWSREDLFETLNYAPEVVTYLLDNAIQSHLKLKDSSGRVGLLENRGNVYAFAPNESAPGATMIERSVASQKYAAYRSTIAAAAAAPPPAPPAEVAPPPPPPIAVEAPVAVEAIPVPVPAYKFPFDVSMFSADVRKSFIVDQVMTRDARQTLILSGSAPEFEQRVEGLDGFVVFGDGKIYDETAGEFATLVGGQLDTYKSWVSKTIDKLISEIAESDKILCTASWDKEKRGVLKMASFSVSGSGEDAKIERTQTSKTIIPKECSFYKADELGVFARLFDKGVFPATKENRCIFLSLACRTPTEKTFWVPPEIWSVVSDNAENASALRKGIKEKQIARKK
jgi:hypothetical protein